jgi:hypothetical protein
MALNNREVVMAQSELWLEPLRQGDIEFKEPVGKTVTSARYICERSLADGPGPGFIEFRFTDGSIFRIDVQARLQARFIPDVEELDQDIDYGVLSPPR